MEIRSGQKLAWANKVAKGFNTTNVPLEFCLLQGEIAEAFDAHYRAYPALRNAEPLRGLRDEDREGTGGGRAGRNGPTGPGTGAARKC